MRTGARITRRNGHRGDHRAGVRGDRRILVQQNVQRVGRVVALRVCPPGVDEVPDEFLVIEIVIGTLLVAVVAVEKVLVWGELLVSS